MNCPENDWSGFETFILLPKGTKARSNEFMTVFKEANQQNLPRTTLRLIIDKFNKSRDEGDYQCCTSEIRVGKASRKNVPDIKVKLIARVKSGKSQSPKVMEITSSNSEGSTELQCTVFGFPLPTVEWRKDGKLFIPFEPKVEETLLVGDADPTFLIKYSFKIDEFDETFTCRASNEAGKAEKDFRFPAVSHADKIILIILLIALLVLLVAAVVSARKARRNRKKIRDLKEVFSIFDRTNANRIFATIRMNSPGDLLQYDEKFEFPKESLTLKECLKAGTFADMTKAIAKGIQPSENETTVVVKSMPKLGNSKMMTMLIAEVKMMIYLGRHPNIVEFLGAVTKNIANREFMIITEFCCFGNIHDFLLNHRSSFVNQITNNEIVASLKQQKSAQQNTRYVNLQFPPVQEIENRHTRTSINTSDLVSWSFQIAGAMTFLGSKNVIHGDVAARNVLLCEGNVVKLCDFDVAIFLHRKESTERRGDTLLPFKWLAVENICDQIFSIDSDVWSYGRKAFVSDAFIN